jgi:hypothetical protein
MTDEALMDRIFGLQSGDEIGFNDCCIEIFHRLKESNPVYARWTYLLNRPDPFDWRDIPFLPIRFFKTHQIISGRGEAPLVFASSTTTSGIPSWHHVLRPEVYHRSLTAGFERFYGHPGKYLFVALLPGYLNRTDASLVYMFRRLMEASRHADSRFFSDVSEARDFIKGIELSGRQLFLIGVSHALLKLADSALALPPESIVMETGGMKGQGPELTREELHGRLKKSFGINGVHSEYGMTELLSQAYARADGLFSCPPWMRVVIRQTSDPLHPAKTGKTGGVNVIDLANVYSCPFIATDDLGKMDFKGNFRILGRFDHADVRGCNLMAQ